MTGIMTGKKKKFKESAAWDTFKRIFYTPSAKLGGILLFIVLFAAIFAPLLTPYSPSALNLKEKFMEPCLAHPFGTDQLGRDIYTRILYGAKYSLSLGLLAAVFGNAIGIVLGSIAGYFGGRVENLIMRLCDVWSAIPGQLMTLLLAVAMGPGFVTTIVAMSIGGWPGGCRMLRAQIMSERGKEYLEACESFNCPKSVIMFKHLLPNVISPMIVAITMQIGGGITAAAGLSYLGLGVRPPTPEWGALLSDAVSVIQSHPYMIVSPGVAIGIVVLGFNLIGDGVRDALDPKLRH
jgi:ABC-type dipeptide/oligopeptide/nickel transport system permease subunit